MGTLTTKEGVDLYYDVWGWGQPIVFCHGWPLSSDSWEPQIFVFFSHGYRCIAHDRGGNGRSSQPSDGNDMDHYADDLAQLLDERDVKNAVLFGISTGGVLYRPAWHQTGGQRGPHFSCSSPNGQDSCQSPTACRWPCSIASGRPAG